MKVSLTLTFILFTAINLSYSASLESSQSIRSRVLQPIDDYGFFYAGWSANLATRVISFIVVAQTTGFVGFGFSTSGGKIGADVVVGGVHDNNGSSYFSDYHAVGLSQPILDTSQDYYLTLAMQNSTHTLLGFSRPFITGDINDVNVTDSEITLVYAYSESDALGYHMSNRGRYITNLLSP